MLYRPSQCRQVPGNTAQRCVAEGSPFNEDVRETIVLMADEEAMSFLVMVVEEDCPLLHLLLRPEKTDF